MQLQILKLSLIAFHILFVFSLIGLLIVEKAICSSLHILFSYTKGGNSLFRNQLLGDQQCFFMKIKLFRSTNQRKKLTLVSPR